MTHTRVEGGSARTLLFGLVIDVTERRGVEMALRRASERAALAARGAGLGTWELDLRDGSNYWDEQMWRLRGLAPRPLVPSAAERLAMVHPDDRPLRRAAPGRLAARRPAGELRVPRAAARRQACAGSRRARRRCADEQGRTMRRIGVNWDITDAHTAAAVRQEREIAQRESQAKSQFLARMSHELRTPLNAVLGFAQLLLAEDLGGDAAAGARRRRVEHIRAAGEHLLSLIDDVLDLSSLEGGELRIALQPVPLAPLVTRRRCRCSTRCCASAASRWTAPGWTWRRWPTRRGCARCCSTCSATRSSTTARAAACTLDGGARRRPRHAARAPTPAAA